MSLLALINIFFVNFSCLHFYSEDMRLVLWMKNGKGEKKKKITRSNFSINISKQTNKLTLADILKITYT